MHMQLSSLILNFHIELLCKVVSTGISDAKHYYLSVKQNPVDAVDISIQRA